jgi:hypothetical protein
MELWESLVLTRFYKGGVVKTTKASHGLTKTCQKGHWKIMLNQGGEREKYTHLPTQASHGPPIMAMLFCGWG